MRLDTHDIHTYTCLYGRATNFRKYHSTRSAYAILHITESNEYLWQVGVRSEITALIKTSIEIRPFRNCLREISGICFYNERHKTEYSWKWRVVGNTCLHEGISARKELHSFASHGNELSLTFGTHDERIVLNCYTTILGIQITILGDSIIRLIDLCDSILKFQYYHNSS